MASPRARSKPRHVSRFARARRIRRAQPRPVDGPAGVGLRHLPRPPRLRGVPPPLQQLHPRRRSVRAAPRPRAPRRAPHLRRKQTPRPRRVRQRVFPRLRRTLTRRRGSARAHRTRPGSPHGRPPRRTPQLRRRRLRRRFLPPARLNLHLSLILHSIDARPGRRPHARRPPPCRFPGCSFLPCGVGARPPPRRARSEPRGARFVFRRLGDRRDVDAFPSRRRARALAGASGRLARGARSVSSGNVGIAWCARVRGRAGVGDGAGGGGGYRRASSRERREQGRRGAGDEASVREKTGVERAPHRGAQGEMMGGGEGNGGGRVVGREWW